MPLPSNLLLPSNSLFAQFLLPPGYSFLDPESNGITEEFDDSRGRWIGYDAYDDTQRAAIRNQEHVDIRSFTNAAVTIPETVFDLTGRTMTSMNGVDMTTLGGTVTIRVGEGWTTGTVGSDSSRNNWNDLQLSTAVPATIAGLELWMDASQLTGLSDGTAVTTATDFSSGGHNFQQATTANKPLYKTGILNGHPVLRFDGVNDWMEASPVLPADQTRTVFIVAKKTTGSSQRLFGLADVDMIVDSGSNWGWANNQAGSGVNLGGTVSNFSIVCIRHNSLSSADAFVDNGAATNFDPNDNYASGFNTTLGSHVNHTQQFWNGDVAEVLSYDSALSEADRQTVLNYLAVKYNIFAATGGTVNSQSLLPNEPVDLLTGFDDNDFISCAFPGFPLSSITTASSFIDFTSNPTGNFTTGPTDSVAFSESTVALVNGNSEFRILRSRLTNVDKSSITGIRFRITGTGTAGTFKAAGLRLLSKNWQYPAVDMDTRYQILRYPPSLTGLTTTPPAFTMPIMWRSTEPDGPASPRPIDGTMAIAFNTGTGVGSPLNKFAVYYREVTEDLLTQLDIDGDTMAVLNAIGSQPDLGTAKYNPRPQTELDTFTQDALGGDEQFALEREADTFSASWVSFVCQWSAATGGSFSVVDSESNGYGFTVPTLATNSNYLMITSVLETAGRLAIYPIDTAGNINLGGKLFDSGWIEDDFLFKRRKGRIGWGAQLQDGSAWVDGFRSRDLVFAEYRLQPYESITPVVGAELFVEASPDRQVFKGIGAASPDATTTITLDTSRSTSGQSFRIDSVSAKAGIESNAITFDDFSETEIAFDLYVPQTSINTGLTLVPFLTNGSREIALTLGAIEPDQWHRHKIRLDLGDAFQAGAYKFALYNMAQNAVTWWLDSAVINERVVSWSGRGVADDPWLSNNALWLDFGDNYNRENSGILFNERGNQLQIRGQARRQDAQIGKVSFRPKYADLGRVTFPSITTLTAPTSSFTVTNPGGLVRKVDGSASSSPNGAIVLYEWNFGDGTRDFGRIVNHTFPNAGATWTVSLTVTDVMGRRASFAQTVNT